MIRHEWAPDLTIYEGDVREVLKALPDESVQCVVTSPPYWGLRDYGTAQWEGGDPECDHKPSATLKKRGVGTSTLDGGKETVGHRQEGYGVMCPRCGARRIDNQIGLEPTPEAFVQTMVDVFREVRRVLRKDGTCWVNLGDSYAGSGVNDGTKNPGMSKAAARGDVKQTSRPNTRIDGLKPKDLVGIPWRVAFALQADGWWLRSDIIWSKPNPMPESVTDRPTKAHEYVFLLTKSATYFYDADAVREPHAEVSVQRVQPHRAPTGKAERAGQVARPGQAPNTLELSQALHPAGRNKRSVWTIATQPFPEAHFATFPEELPRTCILAGTSPQACPTCGAPWERVVQKERSFESGSGRSGRMPAGKNGQGLQGGGATLDIRRGPVVHSTTTGWSPTCGCEGNDGSGKCVVLDPFHGSGTTGKVTVENGRAYIGVELNPQYIEISRRRIYGTQQRLAW